MAHVANLVFFSGGICGAIGGYYFCKFKYRRAIEFFKQSQ